MFVLDTNVLIGAWHMHYAPDTWPVYWERLDDLWGEAALLVPRAVVSELEEEDADELFAWVKDREDRVEDPGQAIQGEAGRIRGAYRFVDGRDDADPFVIAEAAARGFGVATYEGWSPTGTVARPRRNSDGIPLVCEAEGVQCVQPGEIWKALGVTFNS